MRVLRTIRTALLLAAVLTLGPAAAAHAGGPGVIFYPKGRQGVPLLGSQVTGVANIPQRTYTLPARAGRSQVTVSAISVRSLIMLSGVRPETVTFVQIVNGYGGSFVLRRDGFASGLVSDDGRTTRYFRSTGGGTVQDYIEGTDASGPLEISVDGGADIPVRASASPRRAAVGQTVTFRANVRFSPPGERYTYEWDFGDGRTGTGAQVTHVYDSVDSYRPQVSVRNVDPGCATRCSGVEQVAVRVGDPDPQEAPGPAPGGASGGDGPGSASGTGGGGQGGSGGSAAGTGTTPGAKAERRSSPAKREPPPPKRPFGTTISGVLINDTGVSVRKLPSGTPAGAPKGAQAIRGGEQPGRDLQLLVTGLFALGLISLGALRERRGVKLRVA